MKNIIAILLIALAAIQFVAATSIAPEQFQDGRVQYIDGQRYVCYPGPVPIPIPTPVPIEPSIDVVFAIDSTGSMADEIRSVKHHIEKIVRQVESGQPSPHLRVGIVAYRDYELEEREYLLQTLRLTDDIDEAMRFLHNLEAQGGGDYPEAVDDGLHAAVSKMNWDMQAKRLVFLIGDAPPHGVGSDDRNYEQGSPNGYHWKEEVKVAKEKDIAIYTVSGSGMDRNGIRIWKDIAQQTGGRYRHLTYERQDVDQYYAEEGLPIAYAREAKASADYDAGSNTILTNTLGDFAEAAIVAEAESMGVSYGEIEVRVVSRVRDDVSDGSETWLDSDDIFEEKPDRAVTVLSPKKLRITSFFQNAFERIAFWR